MAHELKSVKWGVSGMYVYRGVIIHRIIGGYRVLDKKAKSPEQVDEIINQSLINLKSTVK